MQYINSLFEPSTTITIWGMRLCLIATAFNFLLWVIYARPTNKRNFWDISLFVYIPNAIPFLTLSGGILFIAGLSMISAGFVLNIYEDNSSIFTYASYALSIGLALITLYTLSLHKEDRHKRGNEFKDFLDLMRKLTVEINALRRELDSKKRKSAQILFFTNNPYFGLVTANKDSDHPDANVTRDYVLAMQDLCRSIVSAKSNGIVFRIIYGNDNALTYYHRSFGEDKIELENPTIVQRPPPDDINPSIEIPCTTVEQYVTEINQLTENFVHSLETRCDSLRVIRSPILPRRQYVILNEKVFEFMIKAGVEAEVDKTSKIIDHRDSVRLIRKDFDHWYSWLESLNEEKQPTLITDTKVNGAAGQHAQQTPTSDQDNEKTGKNVARLGNAVKPNVDSLSKEEESINEASNKIANLNQGESANPTEEK